MVAADYKGTLATTNCATTGEEYCTRNTNALEVKWTLPSGTSVPNDNTNAVVECASNLVATDVFKIYSQSIVTDGFGTANCWYSKLAADPFTHSITCDNTGALSSGSSHTVAF
jgi:hypothetical protein